MGVRSRLTVLTVLGALAASAAAVGSLGSGGAAGTPTSERVRFTMVGDISANAAAASVLTGMRDATPDLHLALGDLSYGVTGQEQAWCDFVTSRVGAGAAFELLAGNHESDGQNGNINDFSACLPNQLPGLVGTYGRQYYVDVPQVDPLVRFVMISPALSFPGGSWSYAAGTPRYQWTADTIESARSRGIPWVVVGMHKPCLTPGQYTCEPGPDLLNLLLEREVDLVLSGHEHLYARSAQVGLRSGCAAVVPGTYDVDCVADADDDLTAGQGTVMMVVGTGGTTLRAVNTVDTETGWFRAVSGANLSPSHGFGDVVATPESLAVRFVPVGGGTWTDAFTITRRPVVGAAPVADFAIAIEDREVSLDASSATDADGPLTSYDWSLGDGTTASGVTVDHTYAADGRYPVTLTVTDSDGRTDTLTQDVVVSTAPSPTVLVADDFGRTLSRAWGPADLGGTWTVPTTAGVASVSGGLGRLVMLAPGRQPAATLGGFTGQRVDVTVSASLDKHPAGSGARVNHVVQLRRVGTADYRAIVQVRADGSVSGELARRSSSGTVTLVGQRVVVPSLTATAGTTLQVRAQADGTAPTALRLKVWAAGTPEPAAWLVSASDATADLQAAGGIGLNTYLSTGATNAPVEARYDGLRVSAP